MKKTLLAGLAGGLILYAWAAIAWIVLPLHDASIRSLASEDSVIAVMRTAMNEKAVYMFPAMPKKTPGMSQQAFEAATAVAAKKMEGGPVGMIIYDPTGAPLMMVSQMVKGLVISFFMALLAAWFVKRSTAAASSYFARVIYCGMLGVFVALVAHVTNWNWMGYPFDYTTAWVVDVIIGWLLAGLGIAAFIKTPKQEAA